MAILFVFMLINLVFDTEEVIISIYPSWDIILTYHWSSLFFCLLSVSWIKSQWYLFERLMLTCHLSQCDLDLGTAVLNWQLFLVDGDNTAEIYDLRVVGAGPAGSTATLFAHRASLVDPFIGEGSSNAMASSEIAVEVVKEAISAGDTSRKFLKKYDLKLKQQLSGELKLRYQWQTIGHRFPFLLNLLINKASGNKKNADWILLMIADENSMQVLTSILTCFKLLWAWDEVIWKVRIITGHN